ncbi:MAG TPA: GRRM system radical SAM/SPASM domain protein [Cyanothece sp. UBA12306]|nr:GRRM system radical SAM/SPASM domain protein [Cyanothece sp. UBA12306]
MIISPKPTEKIEAGQISDVNFDNFGPINLVVIQPTSLCNLNCDYCYLRDRKVKNQLSLDLIDPILKTVLTSPFVSHDFTVLWHAGEPLTVPVSFYDQATALIREAEGKYKTQDVQIFQSVQTNATLINQAWCDCFKRNQIGVGVSIDGPAFIHDIHRKTYKGLGSHQETMRGISFLQKNEIYFSIIAVLSQDSLDYPDEIFNFFLENGITDVGFNMEEAEGVNQQSSLNQLGIDQRYQAFMQRFWDLTVQSQGALKIREFETISGIAYTGCFLKNTDMNKPFVIVNFDHQGNFSTFDPELLSVKTEQYGDFIFGNIFADTLLSITDTEKFQKIDQDMAAGLESCRQTCDYFDLCGGGAGSNKYWENGTFNCTETKACRYRIKVIGDIVLAGLENSLGLK